MTIYDQQFFYVSIVVVLRPCEPHSCKMENLTYECMYFDCSNNQQFPIYLLLLWHPVSWDKMILKLGQLITLWWPLSAQVRGRGHTCLIWNQKIEIIKLSEEGMPKVETDQKRGILYQTASQGVNAMEKFLK